MNFISKTKLFCFLFYFVAIISIFNSNFSCNILKYNTAYSNSSSYNGYHFITGVTSGCFVFDYQFDFVCSFSFISKTYDQSFAIFKQSFIILYIFTFLDVMEFLKIIKSQLNYKSFLLFYIIFLDKKLKLNNNTFFYSFFFNKNILIKSTPILPIFSCFYGNFLHFLLF